jgi:CubicO group peptidase (beta-lactamase class C family)
MNLRKFSPALLALSLTIAEAACVPTLANSSPEEIKTVETKFNFKPDFVKATMTDAALQNAISAVDKLAQKQIDEGVVPGMAISIVHNDTVVFVKGYGVRETGKSDKVDADTVFQLASISKAVASTVVAAVVGEKIVSWDSKINDLDPAFALSEPWVTANLTIRDLFAHRSGLPFHSGDVLEDLGYDQAQILHRLRYQKPGSSFRSAYAYTNFGLTEAGLAAAKAANIPWEVLSEEKLYKPLGMNSTSSRFNDFWSRSNKALGHMFIDGKWVHKKQRTPDPQTPAGGVSSSVNDMAKWMRLQIAGGKFEGKQVVDEKALAEYADWLQPN